MTDIPGKPHRIRERVAADRTCLECGHVHEGQLLAPQARPALLVTHAGTLTDLLTEMADSTSEDFTPQELLAMAAGVQALYELVRRTHERRSCDCGTSVWVPRAVHGHMCPNCDARVNGADYIPPMRLQRPHVTGDDAVYEYTPLPPVTDTQH